MEGQALDSLTLRLELSLHHFFLSSNLLLYLINVLRTDTR